jgi:hypothetical protein
MLDDIYQQQVEIQLQHMISSPECNKGITFYEVQITLCLFVLGERYLFGVNKIHLQQLIFDQKRLKSS